MVQHQPTSGCYMIRNKADKITHGVSRRNHIGKSIQKYETSPEAKQIFKLRALSNLNTSNQSSVTTLHSDYWYHAGNWGLRPGPCHGLVNMSRYFTKILRCVAIIRCIKLYIQTWQKIAELHHKGSITAHNLNTAWLDPLHCSASHLCKLVAIQTKIYHKLNIQLCSQIIR